MNTSPRGKLLEQHFQQFRLARKAAPDSPKLIDYVILAEFDIDTGSTVRHVYPSAVPGYSNDWFAEYMLPEGAHNHSLDWTVMFLNKGKEAIEEGEGQLSTQTGGADPFLYCINLVRKKDDPTVRRGAVVKAMAVCSRYHFIEMFRPLLIIALDQYYQSTDAAVLAGLYEAINAADIGALPRPLPWERKLMRRGVCGRSIGSVPAEHLPQKWTHAMSFEYGTQKVQAIIPLHTTPDETLTPSVTLLINVFGTAAMRIYNAVLTGQRVLFVGYNHAAGDVCKFVLAACAMVAPPLCGIVHRTFPYANLSDLSFLETPGYVAGVTNPMFESHAGWWDLLCQLDLPNGTGTVLTSDEKAALDDQKGKKSPPRPPARVTVEQLTYEEDAPFIHKLTAGISGGMSEQWVRSCLRDYTQNLIDLAVDQETGLLPPPPPVTVSSNGSVTANAATAVTGDGTAAAPPPAAPTAAAATAAATATAAAAEAGSSPAADETVGVLPATSPATSPTVAASVVASAVVGSSLVSPTSTATAAKVYQANKWRLREMRKVPDFPLAQTIDPWRCSGELSSGVSGAALRSQIRRLQLEGTGGMEDHEVREAFEDMSKGLQSEASLQVLLGLLPESKGGLFVLGCGLLHTDARTREAALALHKRLSLHDSTRPAVQAMNDFFTMSLYRE